MLAQGSDRNSQSQRSVMMRVLKLCHNHALAVSMAAALQRESQFTWTEMERLLQHHKPEVQWEDRKHRHHQRKYRGLLECMDLSVQHLSPVDRDRYLMLAVLPEDAWVPVELLQHYWNCRDKQETQQLIERLYCRYLIEVNASTKDRCGRPVGLSIKPHDLQLDYLHAAAASRGLSKTTRNNHDAPAKLQHALSVCTPCI